MKLDGLLEKMNAQMKILSDIHSSFEEVSKQFAEQEAEVARRVKDIRLEADQTRATADQVTWECRNYDDDKKKAENKFAVADRELKGLVTALGIL